jgi:hypothetical protein
MNGNLYERVAGQVQFGPIYRCWVCGEAADRLVPFHDWVPAPTALDRYAEHLAYLDLSFGCKQQHHPARVVVVGPAVTPVDWPKHATVVARLDAIREAIDLLTETLRDRQGRVGAGKFDEALALALRLHGRAIAPAQGAQEIRALTGVVA